MGLNALPSPVVDLESICLRSIVSDADFCKIGEAIVEAFEHSGYVYLTNHGVMKQKLDQLVSAFDTFFDLDSETKEKYIASYDTLHGYTTEKLETPEGLDPGLVSGRDCFEYQDYRQSIPYEAPLLKEALSGLFEKAVPMVERVMRAIGCGLGVPFDQFGAHHTNIVSPDDFSGIRVLRYDPVGEDDGFKFRFSEHVDLGVTASFHLYDDAGGLQLKDRSGIWQDTHVSHEAFLLYPGAVLQRWTSDKITAAAHRVAIPKTEEERRRFRHAVVFFATPKKDTVIRSFDGLDKYSPITEGEEMAESIPKFYRPT